MRVLMTTSDHLMIDRRILQEAKTLTSAGNEVTLLAGFECGSPEAHEQDGISIKRFSYDWSDRRFAALVKKFAWTPGSRIHRLSARIFNAWAARIANINSFEQFVVDKILAESFEIIHAHDYPMLAPAVEAARIRGVPLVYDAHELYYAQVQLPAPIRRAYRRREKRLIKSADAVVTVNPYISKLMSERYAIEPPQVLLNAAPLQPVERVIDLRRQLGLPAATKIVMYQGWISSNRGIEILVESARYLREEIVCVIVGYGDYENSLKQIVENKKLADKVFFWGGVPSADLHRITCEADLGVIPYIGIDENNYFCSPNKLFEFAIAQIPFLSNDLPFLADVARSYDNGVLQDITTPEAMARAINDIFSDEGRLERLREGAKCAREFLNWELESRKLIDVYSGLKE